MVEEIIELESWKGKDKIQIEEFPDTFRVIEHRKCKEDGRIDETIHTIPAENVRVLWENIKKKCEYNLTYGYRFLVRMVCEYYTIPEKEGVSMDVMIEAFNGGANRSKWYFSHLYYPLKVLEAKGFIEYYGRGGIKRKI